jgi:hypothetical protein
MLHCIPTKHNDKKKSLIKKKENLYTQCIGSYKLNKNHALHRVNKIRCCPQEAHELEGETNNGITRH